MQVRSTSSPPTGRLRHRVQRAWRPLQSHLRDVFRGLPMIPQHYAGEEQHYTTRKLVSGEVDPCWILDQALDDAIARAKTRADAELVLLIPEVLHLELQARIDAKFGARILSVREAMRTETVAQGAADPLQQDVAHPAASEGQLHAALAALTTHRRTLGDACRALYARLSGREVVS